MTTAKRFPGYNPEQWEAKKQETGLDDKKLYELLATLAQTNIHNRNARSFFSKRGTRSRAMN